MKKLMIIAATLFVAACGSKTTYYHKNYGSVSADNKYLHADLQRCSKQIGNSYRDGNDWTDKVAKCLVKKGWR